MIEVHCEIFEKVRLIGVIAITEYCFITEMIFIVLKFFLNIFQACIKFILFGHRCFM